MLGLALRCSVAGIWSPARRSLRASTSRAVRNSPSSRLFTGVTPGGKTVDGPVVPSEQVEGENRYSSRLMRRIRSHRGNRAFERSDGVPRSGTTSPIFGQENQRLAVVGIGVAFLGMSLLVHAMFRSVVPIIVSRQSADPDLVIAARGHDLLGIKLSLGTVAALLMLIGYASTLTSC